MGFVDANSATLARLPLQDSKILNNSANRPSTLQNPYTLNSATNATAIPFGTVSYGVLDMIRCFIGWIMMFPLFAAKSGPSNGLPYPINK